MKTPKKKLNAVAKRWVKALRSGKYKQGRETLKTDRGTYCCLGVLCDLAVKAKVIPKFPEGEVVLPREVQRWVGLCTAEGSFSTVNGYYCGFCDTSDLTVLNDTEKNKFPTIAKVIESQPKGLFV